MRQQNPQMEIILVSRKDRRKEKNDICKHSKPNNNIDYTAWAQHGCLCEGNKTRNERMKILKTI